MTRRLALLLCLGAALLITPRPMHAQEYEDAPLTFRFDRYVHALIVARYQGDSLYLPVAELLRLLRIPHQLDVRAGTITGEYPADSSFTLDVRAGIARVGGREDTLPAGSRLLGDVDLFLTPAALSRAFQLEFAADMRALALDLRTDRRLPVVIAAEVQERAGRIRGSGAQPDAPLRYDRQRALLAPGVLQYDAEVVGERDASSGALHLTLGGELLGGDIILGERISAQEAEPSLHETQFRWRYAEPRRRWFRQAEAGYINVEGFDFYDIIGGSVGNEPIQPRLQLGTETLSGFAGTDYQVELYRNEQLVATTTADSAGRYAFYVPLEYGGDLLKLMFYSPAGEVSRVYRRMELSQRFLPAGEWEYNVGGGGFQYRDGGLGFGWLRHGFNSWLTGRATVERGNTPAADWTAATLTLDARLFDNGISRVALTPGHAYRFEFERPYGTQGSYGGELTLLDRNSILNTAARSGLFRLGALLPFVVAGVESSTRADVISRWGRDFFTTGVDVQSFLSIGGFRPWLAYHGDFSRLGERRTTTDVAEVGTFLVVRSERPWLRPLAQTLVRLALQYSPRERQFAGGSVELSRPVLRRGRLGFALEHDAATDATRAELSLTLDRAAFRTDSRVRLKEDKTTLFHQVRGTVGYDPVRHGLVPVAREWAGGGGAVFRAFIDADENGRLDRGERVISSAGVRFVQPVGSDVVDGLTRTNDLAAYFRYNVRVDASTSDNPLWMPRFDRFSFIADPNRYKTIDVPFFVGAIVEGKVTATADSTERPLAGVRVLLHRTNEPFDTAAVTFNDGTFYLLGVPPGQYVASIDTVQAAALGADASALSQTFVIRVTEDGDYPPALLFRLRLRKEEGQ